MAHDIFISYATEDQRIAEVVCKVLEENGIACWYAPRDVPFGIDYEEAILDAIYDCRLILLILSSHSNDSAHVRREIQNACAEDTSKPILPFRVENILLSKALRYYLSSAQWLDASMPPVESHLPRLVEKLRARLREPAPADEDLDTNYETENEPVPTEAPPVAPKPEAPAVSTVQEMAAPVKVEAVVMQEAVAPPQSTGWRAAFARFVEKHNVLSRTLLFVLGSLAILLAGVIIISYRLSGPVPWPDVRAIFLVILIFLLIEGLVTYACLKWLRLKRWILGIFFIPVIVLILIGWNAYYVTASVSGVVSDKRGAAIERAWIRLSKGADNFERISVTDESGRYRFNDLEPGYYMLGIEYLPPNFPDSSGYSTAIKVEHKNEQADIQLQIVENQR